MSSQPGGRGEASQSASPPFRTDPMPNSDASWQRSGNLIYSLYQSGWRKGEPVLANRIMIHISHDSRADGAEQDAELLAAWLHRALGIGSSRNRSEAVCEASPNTQLKGAVEREAVARIVKEAVNTALAGVGAPGRVTENHEGVTYYVNRILAAIPASGGGDEREAERRRLQADPVEMLSEALYNLCPFGGQPTDLDGRPTGRGGVIYWSQTDEYDLDAAEKIRAQARRLADPDADPSTSTNPDTLSEDGAAIPDFLKRMTGELPSAPMPAWGDDDGREGRREGAQDDPEASRGEGL